MSLPLDTPLWFTQEAQGFAIGAGDVELADSLGRETAERLVACWNACRGASIERIKHLAHDMPLPEQVEYLRQRLASVELLLEQAKRAGGAA